MPDEEEVYEGQEEEQQEEALPPEVQARFDAAMAQKEAEINAAVEARFQQDKNALTTRWQALDRDLQARGLARTEDGGVAVVDPGKMRDTLLMPLLGGTAQQTRPEDTLPGIDLLAEPEVLAQQLDARARHAASGEVKTLMAEIAEVKQMLMQQSFNAPPDTIGIARTFLGETIGNAEIADTPEFQDLYRQSLNQIPAEMRRNPAELTYALENAALFVFNHMRHQAKSAGRALPGSNGGAHDTQRQMAATANANRAGLAQTGASRGTPSNGGIDLTPEQRDIIAAWPAEWGAMTPDGLAALDSDNTGTAYRNHAKRTGMGGRR